METENSKETAERRGEGSDSSAVVSGDLIYLGEGIGYVNQFYFDKNGDRIKEFDVLKVFHFTGARRKKHYMYKSVRRDEKDRLALLHLVSPDAAMTPLLSVTDKDGRFADAEIVQSRYR